MIECMFFHQSQRHVVAFFGFGFEKHGDSLTTNKPGISSTVEQRNLYNLGVAKLKILENPDYYPE